MNHPELTGKRLAIACYENNTIDQLETALCFAPTAFDCEAWEITPAEFHAQIELALNALCNDQVAEYEAEIERSGVMNIELEMIDGYTMLDCRWIGCTLTGKLIVVDNDNGEQLTVWPEHIENSDSLGVNW